MSEKYAVGGQAVIEGVMMRSKNHIVTAVRKNGKIIYKKEHLKEKHPLLKIFFVRGIMNLVEMLVLGIKTLNWSAAQQTEDDEDIGTWAIVLTLIVAFTFGIVLFLLLPYAITYLIGLRESNHPIWFNIVDGIIKAKILVLYMFLISLIGDIKRVFQYHGAEHKAVFCHEDGKELTVKNCRKYTTKHPRCGTAFLMIVIIVGILMFSFIPMIVNSIYPNIENVNWFLRRAILFLPRILLLPIIAGFAYELLKFGAKHQDNPIFRFLILPGLWVQKITTKEPTDKQLEVGVAALKKVLEMENEKSV